MICRTNNNQNYTIDRHQHVFFYDPSSRDSISVPKCRTNLLVVLDTLLLPELAFVGNAKFPPERVDDCAILADTFLRRARLPFASSKVAVDKGDGSSIAAQDHRNCTFATFSLAEGVSTARLQADATRQTAADEYA